MTETVSRQTGPDRFEIAVDGEVAGFAEFTDRGDRRIFPHTEIAPEFGGRGLGGAVVRAALEATRDEGLSVVPLCPFVGKYIERHPEFAELVVKPRPEDLSRDQ